MARRRPLRLALIAACAILLGFMAWMAWGPGPHGNQDVSGAESPSDTNASIELVGTPDPESRTAAPTPGAAEKETPSTPAETAPVDTETIEGILRVSDDEDLVHEKEDGSFLLVAEDEREGHTIEVRAGRWRTEIRPHVEYRVENVLAGGRPAVTVEYEQPRRCADGNGWEVVARWARSTVLVVRGLDTGLDLRGVDVAAGVPNGGRNGCHPGEVADNYWIARDARSPIAISSGFDTHWQSGTRDLYVRAPGYAWGCVRVPESLGGEYLVALSPGGTLDVTLTGLDASQDAVIRLRPAAEPEGEPMFEERIRGRALVHIESLEAGRWLATVELGHRYRWPQVLARGEVELPVGGLAQLELAVEALPLPGQAPLSGRVLASPAWGFAAIDLRLELLNEAPRGRARAFHTLAARRSKELPVEGRDVWEWSVQGGVMPGRWSVDFFRLGLGLAVDVPPTGREDVVLEIPEPVAVDVLTLDADIGRAVTDGTVGWMPARTWSDVGGQLLDADSLGAGRFNFRAPRGRIELWCFPERHRFLHEVIEAEPPRSERVLRLDLACGFILRVRDGSTLLPWPMHPGWSREVQEIGGEGKGWIQEQDANMVETRFVVTSPGRYRLELPSLPGYAPLRPQEIAVPPGGFARHDVVLTRL